MTDRFLQKFNGVLYLNMYIFYAIKSVSRNYIYVGLTADLEKRLKRHNASLEKTTSPYAPFILIFQKECASRDEARKMEKQLKSTKGKRFLKSLL